MKIEIKQNQTIWDIAVQYTGDSGNALAILQASGKKNMDVNVGEELEVPDLLLSYAMMLRGDIIATGGSDKFVLQDYDNLYIVASLKRFVKSKGDDYCITIRREDDNFEKEFNWINDKLDVRGILSFCGNKKGYVVEMVNQADTGKRLFQYTAINQPLLCDKGKIEIDEGGNYSLSFATSCLLYERNRSVYTVISNITPQLSGAGQSIIMHGRTGVNYHRGSNGLFFNTKLTMFKDVVGSGNGDKTIIDSVTFSPRGFVCGYLKSNEIGVRGDSGSFLHLAVKEYPVLAAPFFIGSNNSPSSFFKGLMPFLLVFKNVLTDEDVDEVIMNIKMRDGIN